MLYTYAGLGLAYFVGPIVLRLTFWKPAHCTSKRKLNGKVALVTGANTGLGKATAADLAARGAHVYLACRNLSKGEQARQEILAANPEAKITTIDLDLNSLASVRSCSQMFLKGEKRLDILVNNAGFGSSTHALSADGIEQHLAVNHLGHFLLTRLLLPLLEKSATPQEKSRVVNVSSRAHMLCKGIDYVGLQAGDFVNRNTAYGQSKLANILNTRYLSKMLAGGNVTVTSLHPGTCRTEFFRNYFGFITSAPWLVQALVGVLLFPIIHLSLTDIEGAQTIIHAAVSEDVEGVSGAYLSNCEITRPGKHALDDAAAERLWIWSCEKSGQRVAL